VPHTRSIGHAGKRKPIVMASQLNASDVTNPKPDLILFVAGNVSVYWMGNVRQNGFQGPRPAKVVYPQGNRLQRRFFSFGGVGGRPGVKEASEAAGIKTTERRASPNSTPHRGGLDGGRAQEGGKHGSAPSSASAGKLPRRFAKGSRRS